MDRDYRTFYVICSIFIFIILILFIASLGLGTGTTYRDPRVFYFNGSEWLGRKVYFVSVSEDKNLTSNNDRQLSFTQGKEEGSEWIYVYSVEDPSRVGFYNILAQSFLSVSKYGPGEELVLKQGPFNRNCEFIYQLDIENITLNPAALEGQNATLFITAVNDKPLLESYSGLSSDFSLFAIRVIPESC